MSAGGKLSRSASAIVADSASGYHVLKVDCYSRTTGTPTGDYVMSVPFTVGGHRWCIRYYPNGNRSENAGYASFFLVLDETVAKPVKAQYQFRFFDDVEGKPLRLEEAHDFEDHHGVGYPQFIKREELEKSKHLKDDSFTVRCDVVVVTGLRAEEMRVPDTAPPAFVSVPPPDLHLHLGDLLLTGKGADVAFEVGAGTFAAHRCVLAARSPVFAAELLGAMKEGHAAGAVRVDDMEAPVFGAMLGFVYTDSLPEMSKGEEDAMSQHLLVAADRYGLERLKLICEDRLCGRIQVSNLATILALADQHHCHGLKKACFSFLRSPENLRAFVPSDGFEDLSTSCPSVMRELVAMLGTYVH